MKTILKYLTLFCLTVGNAWAWNPVVLVKPASGIPTTAFVFTITTTTTPDTFTLPIYNGGTYNFTVDWGDSSSSTITAYDDADNPHTYATPGTYQIIVTGTLYGFSFNNGGDKLLMRDVSQWGNMRLGNGPGGAGGHFYGCTNLTVTATDVLDMTGTTTFYNAFQSCSSLTTVPSMNSWDVSAVTNMDFTFYLASSFNQNIGSWDVSAVTSFNSTFRNATAFNQDIGLWVVSAASVFERMFESATAFNQDIGSWVVSSGTNFSYMFSSASAFNQDISSWNVSAGTNFTTMFSAAISFNQDISLWNVSSGTDFAYMFQYASAFNQDISSWNVSAGTNFTNMFQYATSFNQPIGLWNTSAATLFVNMFNGATSFNQNLAGLEIALVTNATNFLQDVTLSTANYDALLIGWEAQVEQPNVVFHGGNSKYTSGGAAEAARTALVASGWTITDGGAL